jgi:hypothetical protein
VAQIEINKNLHQLRRRRSFRVAGRRNLRRLRLRVGRAAGHPDLGSVDVDPVLVVLDDGRVAEEDFALEVGRGLPPASKKR